MSQILGSASNVMTTLQRGVIRITAGNTSNTATISAVTTANARLNSSGRNTDFGGVNEPLMATKIVLTNATTVTMTVNTGAGGNCDHQYEVCESPSGMLRSVNRGTATAGTASISAVDTTKTETSYLGCTTTVLNTNISSGQGYAVVTNATTITISTQGAANTTVSWQAAEWTA